MEHETASHLRLLAVFHYVLAGLGALSALLPAFYIAIGYAMLTGAFAFGGRLENPPPPEIGWIFVGIGSLLLSVSAGYVILVVVAGRFLARRRHWTYCVVVAALSCAFFPLGTALGVLTILVLARPAVKAAFGVVPHAAPPAPGP